MAIAGLVNRSFYGLNGRINADASSLKIAVQNYDVRIDRRNDDDQSDSPVHLIDVYDKILFRLGGGWFLSGSGFLIPETAGRSGG